MQQPASYPSVALSYYPLPQVLIDQLSAREAVPIESLSISSIHELGITNIVRMLRTRRFDAVYILTLGRGWIPFIPMVRIVAQVMCCRRRVLVGPQFATKDDRGGNVIFLTLVLALHWLSAWPSIAIHAARILRLSGMARVMPAADPEADEVLYLRANLGTSSVAGGSVSHTMGVISGLIKAGLRVRFVTPGDGLSIVGPERILVHYVPCPAAPSNL